jgi:hypothetical protein
MIKKLFFISLVSLSIVSCKTAIQPNYVSTSEVASLNIGMTKQDAKTVLGNLSPFDILMAEQGGCEVHQYKYKTPAKEISSTSAMRTEGLTEGKKKYVKESDVFLVYKNGKLESVLTDAGKSDAMKLIEQIDETKAVCSEEGLKGCTDPASLNYNPNAIIDDGKCEYCPCGTIVNKNYNPKLPISECNQKCVKIAVTEEAKDNNESDCTNCELIEKLAKANANVNINLELPAEGSSEKSAKKDESKKVKILKKITPKK